MFSLSNMSVMRHVTLLSTALALSLGSASAQSVNSRDSSNSAISEANESSSNALQLDTDSFSSISAALPSASAASGSGGGQYDNRSARRRGYSHLAFEAGAGFSAPTEESSPYITWGGNATVGVGYRFNSMFTLMSEYQFIDDKLPGALIAETGATGGHAHIWSLTLDPVIDLTPKGPLDVYVTGGGGFYRKVTSFTDPQEALYCDYFFCSVITQNVVVGHFSSNQGGWNVGAGIAHRLGNNMKLFAEARYLNIDTPAVTTEPNGLGTTSVGAETKIIPVTFGVRW